MNKDLNEMFEAIISQMSNCGFKKRTLNDYKMYYNYLVQDLRQQNIEGKNYSFDVLNYELERLKILLNESKISYNRFKRVRKVIDLLQKYDKTGAWKFEQCSANKKYVVKSPYFAAVIEQELIYYIQKFHLSKSSNSWHILVFKKLCCYLENIGRKDFNNLSKIDIIEFIKSLNIINKNSISAVLHHLQLIIDYLANENLANIKINVSLFKPQTFREKNIVFFSKDEAKALLNAIDLESINGLRDFAIISLGFTTGLRKVDLINLKLDNILWKQSEINFVQLKTGIETNLPLLSNTGNAIKNYINSERPITKLEEVFLTNINGPTRSFSKRTADSIVRKYCKKANIIKPLKCTYHTLRRSYCTWMAQNSISLDTIAQCMGHSDVHTTDRYISVSPLMANCCLSFDDIEPIARGDKNV